LPDDSLGKKKATKREKILSQGDPLDDAVKVAHRLGGIVANDDRVRSAIQNALSQALDPAEVLAAVTGALTQ
jgi:hypothetical protein